MKNHHKKELGFKESEKALRQNKYFKDFFPDILPQRILK